MLADMRREYNQPSAEGYLSDHEMAAYINRAQDQIVTRILEADRNFFEDSDQSLGFISGQEEYDLPRQIWNRKITRVTQTDVNPPDGFELTYRPFQQAKREGGAGWPAGQEASIYYLRDQKIGIKPTPQRTVSANLLIHFLRKVQELHWAQVESPGATSFTMPTSTVATPPYLKAGRISTEQNYYVGARIRMIGGTDRGLERRITAFDVATRIATIDSAWTPANVQNQDYVILTPIPDEYHQLLYKIALLQCGKKGRDAQAYQFSKSEAADLWMQMESSIGPRHQDKSRHVPPPVDDWE